ncbi:MAG: hypothetical protein K5990_02755, partial [Oscillospiraceae bacterium]|nr:hypothetical protein [Oscillospiraceae bacterium]
MKKLTATALCLLMAFLFFACGKQAQTSGAETDKMLAWKETYPEYFDLSTSKGLEVYVWQIVPNRYSFG